MYDRTIGKILFACCLPFFLASSLYAQSNRRTGPRVPPQISGVVRYAETGRPILGAVVTLSSEMGEAVQQAGTDTGGRFQFENIQLGAFYVTAEMAGYEAVRIRVDVSQFPRQQVYLNLKPRPGRMDAPANATDPLVPARNFMIPPDAQREFEDGRKQLLKSKDLGGSISHLRKAIQIYPNFAEAYMLLGTAYMDGNKWKDAESTLEKAIQLDQKLAGAYLALGTCYNQEGKFAEAEKLLVHGLELDPKAAEGHYELGRAHWALGRWQDAAPHVRKAIELKPGFPPAHVLLGNVMLRERNAQGALGQFKEYLRLDPKGPFAEPTREIVAKIEKALAASK